jgi:hypothetical protein
VPITAGTEWGKWAAELSYDGCILEIGKRQPKAIALYRKMSYNVIWNYGWYAGTNSGEFLVERSPSVVLILVSEVASHLGQMIHRISSAVNDRGAIYPPPLQERAGTSAFEQ